MPAVTGHLLNEPRFVLAQIKRPGRRTFLATQRLEWHHAHQWEKPADARPLASGSLLRVFSAVRRHSPPTTLLYREDSKSNENLRDRREAGRVTAQGGQALNPKPEARNPNQCPKSQWPNDGNITCVRRIEGNLGSFDYWAFGHWDLIRISGFGFRISCSPYAPIVYVSPLLNSVARSPSPRALVASSTCLVSSSS